MLRTGVHALARGGRLVVIGAMSQYAVGWTPSTLPPGVPELLLWRGASISGFFLLHHAKLYHKHLTQLIAAWRAGRLHVALDPMRFRQVLFLPDYTSMCMKRREQPSLPNARSLHS